MLFPTFWDFVRHSSSNIKGVMAISKFDLLCDLVTQLFDFWPIKTTWFCLVVDYIRGQSLVMISKKLQPVSRKMLQFHLNMNIEGRFDVTLWRHQWRHQHQKYFGGLILDGLSISNVKMNISKSFRNFQNGRHFEVRRTFKPEVVPEVESYTKIGHAIPYILRFCSTF